VEARQTENGIQFVGIPHRGDGRMVFAHGPPKDETRGSGIAQFGGDRHAESSALPGKAASAKLRNTIDPQALETIPEQSPLAPLPGLSIFGRT
jgi:hypothetical protein